VISLDWHEDSLCADSPDPDLWFPVTETHDAIAAAKAVCAECPVARECLTYALDTRERFGIWGGASTQLRGRLLSRKGVVA
jgi:WhiB family redox-sensing transcriptional regulator